MTNDNNQTRKFMLSNLSGSLRKMNNMSRTLSALVGDNDESNNGDGCYSNIKTGRSWEWNGCCVEAKLTMIFK